MNTENALYSQSTSRSQDRLLSQNLGFESDGDLITDTLFYEFLGLADRNWNVQTNDTASIFVHFDDILGKAEGGAVKQAHEAYAVFMGARKKTEVENGHLLGAAHVKLFDLHIIFPDNDLLENIMSKAFSGGLIKKMKVTLERNIGKPGRPAFEIELVNARVSAVYSKHETIVVSFGFEKISMQYYSVGHDAKLSGKVAASFDLHKNKESAKS